MADSYQAYAVFNASWSASDIQVGQFPVPPEFTDIEREPGGVRVFWNADTNKTHTLEYFLSLGGLTNVLATNLPGPSFLDTNASQVKRFYRLLQE